MLARGLVLVLARELGLGPELELELALVPMTERVTEDMMKMKRPGTPVTHPTLPWHAAGH